MNKTFVFITAALVLVGVIGFRLTTRDTNSAITVNTDNLRRVTLKIDSMYCASCPYNLESAL